MPIQRSALQGLAKHGRVSTADCRKLWQLGQERVECCEPLDVDTGLLKNLAPVPHHENVNFQFRGEFFNLFNHPQWADPNATFANAAFGTIRATIGGSADYRIIQVALKMNF